jgi:hypothetical protein
MPDLVFLIDGMGTQMARAAYYRKERLAILHQWLQIDSDGRLKCTYAVESRCRGTIPFKYNSMIEVNIC